MTTVVISDNAGADFSGTDDCQIKSGAATTNYGSDGTMEVTKWAVGDHLHSLLKFTGLSNITGPVTVSSATLELYLSSGDPGTHTISMYRLLRNWVESQATWNIFSTSNNWGTAGGLNATDRSSTLTASASVNNTSEYKSFTSAQLAQDVQDFINGVNPNYGWHFERTGGGDDNQGRIFHTSESVSDTSRPKLTVVYTLAGAPLVSLAYKVLC